MPLKQIVTGQPVTPEQQARAEELRRRMTPAEAILPVVKQFGIDLIHYSIVITAAVGIGLFLPPIGVGVFISCGIAKISVDRVLRPMLPYVIFLCLGLLIVVCVPWFTLILPRLLGL